mmetsp:Transcript_111128/g.166419  ORF Transcript_111128/g.166419 Transcript_111128/m.166419 type:complete len:641 (-) Transcript_111128:237-2159(-)
MAENDSRLSNEQREKELYELRAKGLASNRVHIFEDLSLRSKRRLDRIILGEGAGNELFRDPRQNTAANMGIRGYFYDGFTELRNLSTESTMRGSGRLVETYENDAESTGSCSVSTLTFNESLFVRNERDLENMERMDEVFGVLQDNDDEEEIIFEHDTASDTDYGENAQWGLFMASDRRSISPTNTHSMLVDVNLYDSPSSQDCASSFRNEHLSREDKKFLGTSPVSWMSRHVLKGITKRDGIHAYIYKSEPEFSPVEQPSSKRLRRPSAKRRRCGCLMGLALLLVLSVGVAGAFLLAIAAHRPQKTLAPEREIPLASNTTESLRLMFGAISGTENLDDPSKPQSKTLEWLLSDDDVLSKLSEFNYDNLLERYLVALLHFSMRGETWDEQHNFLSASHVCEWNVQTPESTGVICDNDKRVTHLLLGDNNLDGSLPFELANLEKLQVIELYENHITGQVPTQIGLLRNVDTINLSLNSIQGSVPSEMGELSSLQYLDIGSNKIGGSVPTEIGNLLTLQWLSLAKNKLEGGLPSEMGRMTMLRTLNIYNNKLEGSIPRQIGKLNLSVLNARSNQLEGDISADFCHKEYDSLWADCYGSMPLVECSCCTVCCDGNICCSEFECCSIEEDSSCVYGYAQPVPFA